MVTAGDLPFEITEQIFHFLTLNSLRNAALASSVFRTEALKYLYQSVTISISLDGDVFKHYLRTKERPDLDALAEKMRFFAAPSIAQRVRKCTVRFVTEDAAASDLVDDFFKQMTTFTRLEDIILEGVPITNSRAKSISECNPATLRSLVLRFCSPPLTSVGVRQSISVPRVRIVTGERHGVRWLWLFNPESIHTLDLSSRASSVDALEELATLDPMCIRSLILDGDESVAGCDALPVALAKCPELERLKVTTQTKNCAVRVENIPEEVELVSYDGHQDTLKPVLATQKKLRRVRLDGTRWEGTCDRLELELQLPQLQVDAPALEALQLRAFPTSSLCTLIERCFPRLKSLCFDLPLQQQSQEPMFALTREHFFTAVRDMPLPPHVEHLVIIAMIHSDPIEGKQIIESLTAAHASLTHIYLHFPNNYWMTWEVYPPNRVCVGEGIKRGYITQGYLDVDYMQWF